MTEKIIDIKSIVRNYILKIGGLLKEEINDPKLEYGFGFIYPNTTIGKPMTVVQLKKKEHIEISFVIRIDPKHVEEFKTLEEADKRSFMKTLHKMLFRIELPFILDFRQKFFISLLDKIYIENDTISLNTFFKSVQKIYSQAILILVYVQDFFSDEFIIDDSVYR